MNLTIKKRQGVNSAQDSTLAKPFKDSVAAMKTATQTGKLGKMTVSTAEALISKLKPTAGVAKLPALPDLTKPIAVDPNSSVKVTPPNSTVGGTLTVLPLPNPASADIKASDVMPRPLSVSDVAMSVVAQPAVVAQNKNYLRARNVPINSKNPFEIATRAAVEQNNELKDLAKNAISTHPELFEPNEIKMPSLVVGEISDDVYNMDLQEFNDFANAQEAQFSQLSPLVIMANQFCGDNFAPMLLGTGGGMPSNFGGHSSFHNGFDNATGSNSVGATAGQVAGGAAGTAVLPVVGTYVGAKVGEILGSVFDSKPSEIKEDGGATYQQTYDYVKDALEKAFLRGNFTPESIKNHVAWIRDEKQNPRRTRAQWYDLFVTGVPEYNLVNQIKSYYAGLGVPTESQRFKDFVWNENLYRNSGGKEGYSRDFLTAQAQKEFSKQTPLQSVLAPAIVPAAPTAKAKGILGFLHWLFA